MSHSNFEKIAAEMGKMVADKNIVYGDSFSKASAIIDILFPDGVKPHQYRDFLAIIRVIDKLFRIATRKNAYGESPWRDIMGYALLSIEADERANIEKGKKS